MRQKTNVPDGHWHTCHGATPYPPPSKETHRIWAIPTSDLGRGWGVRTPGPPPPRPAPPLNTTVSRYAIVVPVILSCVLAVYLRSAV